MYCINHTIDVNSKLLKKKCVYLANSAEISFCLKLKDFGIECPNLCPFFLKGEKIQLDYLLEKHYDLECLYCTRKKNKLRNNFEEYKIYCVLRKNFDPNCRLCPFTVYK